MPSITIEQLDDPTYEVVNLHSSIIEIIRNNPEVLDTSKLSAPERTDLEFYLRMLDNLARWDALATVKGLPQAGATA